MHSLRQNQGFYLCLWEQVLFPFLGLSVAGNWSKVVYEIDALTIGLCKGLKEFNKEYKYTVGESIKKETIEMIVNIYRANSRKDKVGHIVKARENIEVIRVLLRLLRDLKWQ